MFWKAITWVKVSFLLSVLLLSNAAAAAKEDKLFLEQAVRFEAQIIFLAMNVPGMVIGVVRDGESVVLGFGERGAGAGEPDGDTIIKIGSISKAAAGQVFAGLVADGTVHFADRLEERLGWKVPVPALDGRPITLLDLATHASGLPREVEHVHREAAPDLISRTDYESALGNQPLLFAPGTGLHYSNYGFDLLGEALANSAKRPYAQLLKEKVLEPAGMKDTYVQLAPEDEERLFRGHLPDGTPFPVSANSDIQAAASGLLSTANDMTKWLAWHLDRSRRADMGTRTLDHAAYVQRDGLDPVSGLDESGHMNAMGLGWIIMHPEGDRPLILQKAGGWQGTLSYVAFSPQRGVGVFISINKFDFAAANVMTEAANHIIEQLAPR